MPKATIEYDLDTERLEFRRATNATSAYLVLWDILEHSFRRRLKYGLDDLSDETVTVLEEVREEIVNSMDMHGVTLEDLE